MLLKSNLVLSSSFMLLFAALHTSACIVVIGLVFGLQLFDTAESLKKTPASM